MKLCLLLNHTSEMSGLIQGYLARSSSYARIIPETLAQAFPNWFISERVGQGVERREVGTDLSGRRKNLNN